VEAAYNIARFTADDDCAGLADADQLEMAPRDLQLFYPWDISTAEAVALAQRAEAAAFAVDPRITNSEGAGVHVQQSHFVSANSRGFIGGYPYSRHTLSVAPIAGKGANMQRDDWYSSVRDAPDVVAGSHRPLRRRARAGAPECAQHRYPYLPGAVRSAAGGWPAGRLRAGHVGRCAVPQVDLPARFAGQAGAAQAYADHGRSAHHRRRRLGAVRRRGVRTVKRDVVKDGVVQGYFLSTYSARKLGMQTTGNAAARTICR
jgi:PmbA protein